MGLAGCALPENGLNISHRKAVSGSFGYGAEFRLNSRDVLLSGVAKRLAHPCGDCDALASGGGLDFSVFFLGQWNL